MALVMVSHQAGTPYNQRQHGPTKILNVHRENWVCCAHKPPAANAAQDFFSGS